MSYVKLPFNLRITFMLKIRRIKPRPVYNTPNWYQYDFSTKSWDGPKPLSRVSN